MARAEKITDRAGQFFIGGTWVDADAGRALDVVNPETEQAICQVALGTADDLDRAVEAARAGDHGDTSSSPVFVRGRVELRRPLLPSLVDRRLSQIRVSRTKGP